MSSYLDHYREERKNLDFSLFDFVNHLNLSPLNDFIEDVMTENEVIHELFPSTKGLSSDDLAFRFIREMPYATYVKICNQLERIFSNAISHKYPNEHTVINNVIALTARQRRGLSYQYIVQHLEDRKISEELKTDLAILMSKLEGGIALYFSDRNIDYGQRPYLIPAFISAFKETDPAKALGKLAHIERKPENFQLYIRPITTALENILLQKRDFSTFTSLYDRMPSWVKSEFDKIIEKRGFVQHGIRADINAFNQKRKEFKIGIGLFPDLILLDLAAKEGLFTKGAEFFNVKIVDWNKIFHELLDDELDFIISNQYTCELRNKYVDNYTFITPLIEYKGFSIIFQKESTVSTFKILKNALDQEDDYLILKQTLNQLKNKSLKIFASKDTDHYFTLVRLLDLVGLKEKDVNIVSDKEPYEGSELFSKKQVDAIVGGLPQKLQALKEGGKDLVALEDFPLPFHQVNGLICRSDKYEKLKPQAGKIVEGWLNIVKQIDRQPSKLQGLVSLYNAWLAKIEPAQSPIDEQLFKEHWSKTYFIPSTPQELEMLKAHETEQQHSNLKEQLASIRID
jgi:ABC-type nitrate/sulfonate/bicarbonate transport system substrate-binding protein